MVQVEFDPARREQRFILRPNRSLSWRAAQRLLWGAGVFILGVAGVFALKGLWLVLPFAGLEILVLAYAMWRVFQCQQRQQVLCLGDNEVVLEEGATVPEQRWQCQRPWCRVRVYHVHPWYPRQVWLRCHSRWVQIGDFLPDEERKRLQQQLKQVLTHE